MLCVEEVCYKDKYKRRINQHGKSASFSIFQKQLVPMEWRMKYSFHCSQFWSWIQTGMEGGFCVKV